MYRGYNPEAVNKVMTEMANAYSMAVKKVRETFDESLKPVLRAQWIGPDEQDFEMNLIKRINTMFMSSQELTKNAIQTIRSLAISWADFQNKNKIDGSNSNIVFNVESLLIDIVPTTPEPIVFQQRMFSANDNLGLAGSDSRTVMGLSLGTFVAVSRREINNLFETITFNKAFFGDQLSSLDKFKTSLSEALGTINTSVKDFNDAMDSLVDTNYSQSDATVTESMSSFASDLDASVAESTSGSRWT